MVGNGAAGVFHELDAGNPAGDRQPIRLRHFCGRQQFGRQQFHVAARCILTCPQIPARRFTHLITEWARLLNYRPVAFSTAFQSGSKNLIRRRFPCADGFGIEPAK
jgi:hypothetical protein